MEVVITNAERAAHLAADILARAVADNPRAVFGVATGSTPLGVYSELGRRVRAGEVSLREARAFALDEYVGLPAGDPRSYRQVIADEFVAEVDIDPGAVHAPNGAAHDLVAACADFERRIIEAGGVDVQVLGIGSDGHIAFNEPGSSLASRTRVKTLTDQTRRDNARFFDDDLEAVPRHCVTQGLGTIMEARHIVLLAFGEAKAEAVHELVEGAVSARWPATVLQHHPHVTVLCDEAAAGHLELAGYYRETFANKPVWQSL